LSRSGDSSCRPGSRYPSARNFSTSLAVSIMGLLGWTG
jgi:hypothetical protein